MLKQKKMEKRVIENHCGVKVRGIEVIDRMKQRQQHKKKTQHVTVNAF